MQLLEQLKQLPFHEKLRVIEALWDDLTCQEEQLDVPEWHKEILNEREKLLREGEAEFIDWEVAKKQIQEEIANLHEAVNSR